MSKVPKLICVVQVLKQTVVALRLRHPNIVTVMGTSVDPPTKDLLLITALLERGTLYDLLHTVGFRFFCSNPNSFFLLPTCPTSSPSSSLVPDILLRQKSHAMVRLVASIYWHWHVCSNMDWR